MIESLKFWMSVVDEALGSDVSTQDFIEHVINHLRAEGFKIRPQLWEAIHDMRKAQLNARK